MKVFNRDLKTEIEMNFYLRVTLFNLFTLILLILPKPLLSQEIQDVTLKEDVFYITVDFSSINLDALAKIKSHSDDFPVQMYVWSVDEKDMIARGINNVSFYRGNYTYSSTNKHYIFFIPDGSYDILNFDLTAYYLDDVFGWVDIYSQSNISSHLVKVDTSCDGIDANSCILQTSLKDDPKYVEDTVLMVFDSSDNLIGLDFDDGVGFSSRISSDSFNQLNLNKEISYVLVGSNYFGHSISYPSYTTLYASDLNLDSDGDLLSHPIESILGTCDSLSTHEYCTSVFNTKDTDRDGLEDTVEIFGIENQLYHNFDVNSSSEVLWFHHWGASPVHKDAFIELDYDILSFDSNPLSELSYAALESWFDLMQKPYLDGSGVELNNPDGGYGIILHIDIGYNVPERMKTKMGDWGGGGDLVENAHVDSPDQAQLARDNMSLFRSGYFRYAVGRDLGGGQADSDRPAFVFDLYSAKTFAHELGHTVGLHHYSTRKPNDPLSEQSLNVNCNPFYRSLMNYSHSLNTFSHGNLDMFLPEPINADETFDFNGLIGLDFFDNFDSNVEVSVLGVDWNLNGEVDNSIIRTPMNVGHRRTCGIYFNKGIKHTFDSFDKDNLGFVSTPTLFSHNKIIYFMYLDDEGSVAYSYANINTLSDSSCDEGNLITSPGKCFDWQGPFYLNLGNSKFNSISSTVFKGGLYISLRDSSNLDVYVYSFDLDLGNPILSTPINVSLVGNSYTRPSLSKGVFGYDMCVYMGSQNDNDSDLYDYIYSCLGPQGSWESPSSVLDENGNSLSGRFSPSVIHWPNLDPIPADYIGRETMCGVFSNQDNKVDFYCLDTGSGSINKWFKVDFFEFNEYAYGDLNISYVYDRNNLGEVMQSYSGRFLVSFAGNNSGEPEGSWTFAGRALDHTDNPIDLRHALSVTRTRDEWSWAANNSSAFIYDHESLGGAKGGWIRINGDNVEVQFYRTGDGVYNGFMRDNNDFHVMEAFLCRDLKLGFYGNINDATVYANKFCGNFAQTVHGY